MFIRQFIVLISLGILIFFLGAYFVSVKSPLDLDKLQEYIIEQEVGENEDENLNLTVSKLVAEKKITLYFSENILIAISIFTISLTCLTASIHLLIDKLFFRKFYETASLFNSVRRGFALAASIFIAIYLHLAGSPFLEVIFSVGIVIMIEVLFTMFLLDPLSNGFKNAHRKIADTPSSLDSSVSSPSINNDVAQASVSNPDLPITKTES